MFNRENIFRGFIWKFLERSCTQLLGLFISIVLARLLLPDDYGTVALCLVITTILEVFVDSGLGVVLVQRKRIEDDDYNAVFVFNMVVSFVLYFFIYFFASYIESIFSVKNLEVLLKTLGITLLISGVKNVQMAYVTRNLLFKKTFYATLIGTLISGVVAVMMAYNDFGYWSLVAQQLINNIMVVVVLGKILKLRLSFKPSITRVKNFLSFGYKLLCANLINVSYGQFWQLAIGKIYSPSDLAFYNQGNKFASFTINNISTAMDNVLFPALSQVQDDRSLVRNKMRKAMKMSVFIVAPLQMIMAFSSSNIISVVLTEKWLPAVPFFSIFCINYMFTPLHTANLNAIKAIGRADLILKLEITRKTISFLIVLYAMQYSIIAMAYALLVGELVGQIVNTWPNKKLLKYGYSEQLKDIMPAVAMAVFSGMAAYSINYLEFNKYLTLSIQLIVGGFLYLCIACLIYPDILKELVNMIAKRKE